MIKKILFIFTLTLSIHAQDIKSVVQEVLSTNPTILERHKNYNATLQNITQAESGYYPKVELSLGFGYEHTVKDSIAKGVESFNYEVYQNSLKLTQNLFNGFETTYKVKQQQNHNTSAAYSYVESVNSIVYETISAYLEVMRNKELFLNAKSNVGINQEIFQKVKKLYNAGLTTLSEVNKIESSLALAKSDYVVQESFFLDAIYNMQKILGRYPDPNTMKTPEFNIQLPNSLEEATQTAMHDNPSILIGKYNIKISQDAYKEAKSAYYPKLDLEVSQTLSKNVSAIEGEFDRFKAMVYLKYNIFNGFSDSAKKQKGISQIHQDVELKNKLLRDIIARLNLSWSMNKKLSEQLVFLEEYQKFSKQTLTLYAQEYDLGRRSLLDFLSAQNDFIGSKAQIIEANYNILLAKYKILDSMGHLVEHIVGDNRDIYANVGLDGNRSNNSDTLPINFDKDNDLIVDDNDICNNSKITDTKNIFGCKFIYEDTQTIERYNGFLFDDDSTLLTKKAKTRVSNLIKQIELYGLEFIRLDILGNSDIENATDEEMNLLAQKRAQKIKDLFVKAGVKDENILIYYNSAPIYSNESSSSIDKNNRVDIVVRKLYK